MMPAAKEFLLLIGKTGNLIISFAQLVRTPETA